MGIGYGSNFPLVGLSPEQVGVINEKETSGIFGVLSVLFNIADVAISFVSGGTLATVAGLANAGIQAGLNYAETGEVSPLSIGISIAASVIPGAASKINNIRQGNKIIKAAESGLVNNPKSVIIDEFISALKGRNQVLKRFGEEVRKKGISRVKKTFLKNPDKYLSNVKNYVLGGIPSNPIRFLQGGNQILANSKKIFDEVNIVGSAILGRSVRTIIEGGKDITSRLLNSAKAQTGLFKSEIIALKSFIKDGIITNSKGFLKIITKAFERTGNKLLGLAVEGVKKAKLLKVLIKTETTTMKFSRIASKTAQWTTKLGGYVSSPSSLAADAISKTVGKLTSKVEAFGAEITAKIGKWIKKGSKTLKMLEDEFERTGGTLIKSSWIMGFKVLQDNSITTTILVQFKNKHPNIIANLTSGQLKAFITASSKGRWYINNIARSRGGRSVSELGITGNLANLMGMLPISKINEIVGFSSFAKNFASQVRANSGTMIWHTNNYIKGFKQGVIQGIIAESIKGFVSLGTTNQYAKQFLEGGFGAMSSGTNFGTAFSKSFAGATQSMRDAIFEDTTQAGAIVKNVKVIKGTGSSMKGLI